MATLPRWNQRLLQTFLQCPQCARGVLQTRTNFRVTIGQSRPTATTSGYRKRSGSSAVTFGDTELDGLIDKRVRSRRIEEVQNHHNSGGIDGNTKTPDPQKPPRKRRDAEQQPGPHNRGSTAVRFQSSATKPFRPQPQSHTPRDILPGDVKSYLDKTPTNPKTRPRSSDSNLPKYRFTSTTPLKPLEDWQIQKAALRQKFKNEPWAPRKKLSPDAIQGIRDLHAQDPIQNSTPELAQQFEVSPEAIRRILKSKWRASEEKMQERRERWARRHDQIWDMQAELGLKPKRMKEKSVDGPEVFDDEVRQKEMLRVARKDD